MARLVTTNNTSDRSQPSDNEIQHPAPATFTVTNDALNLSTIAPLNLSVLQRHLPSAVSIDLVAPTAHVYRLSAITGSWEKTEVEGTLFVVRLQDGAHAVVVLNRNGLNNLILHLKSVEKSEVTDDLIFLQEKGADRLGSGDVYGLYVFQDEEGSTKGLREACGRYILECAERAGKEPEIGSLDGQPNGYVRQQLTAGAPSAPDLMALLNPSRG